MNDYEDIPDYFMTDPSLIPDPEVDLPEGDEEGVNPNLIKHEPELDEDDDVELEDEDDEDEDEMEIENEEDDEVITG